jgi:uncharacterized membrane protein
MKIRPLVIIGAAVVVAMLLLSSWAWFQLPDDAQIPVHWGPSGEADAFGPKWLGLLGLPLVAMGILALLAFIPRIEPRRENLERSSTAYVAIGVAVLALMAAIHVFAVLAALGSAANIAPVAGIGVGVLFVVIGNFIGKTRSNWFFGIRTPWTLSSERAWTRTHRLGGYLFLALGAAMIVAAFLLPPEAFIWIVLIGVFGLIGVLFGYSYLVWRNDPDRRTLS